ncbi:MAG: hypothetical protein HY327_02765 [Chloroflexi bacterium]|nr:hypothetical protein [Chloroflexota bacterium]
MQLIKKKKRIESDSVIRVLVVSRQLAVIQALVYLGPCHTVEAITTRGAYAALQGAQLAIIDWTDVVEDGMSKATLLDVVTRSGIPSTTPDEFLQNPAAWRAHALAAAGNFASFPPARVAFTSFSGGVGKTTLTLDTAIRFASVTNLPTAVLELTHAPSSLRVITNIQPAADFYAAATKEDASILPRWRGVTIALFDYQVGRLLESEADRVTRMFKAICRRHILTLVDSEFPHALLDMLAPQIEKWFVLASPKADALNNARALRDALSNTPNFKPPQVIYNLVERFVDQFGKVGLDPALTLALIQDPERFDGRLGERVLPLIYPYWQSAQKGKK